MLVDRHTLKDVLAALARICSEKACHLEDAWQDRQTARVWEKACRKVDVLASSIHELGV